MGAALEFYFAAVSARPAALPGPLHAVRIDHDMDGHHGGSRRADFAVFADFECNRRVVGDLGVCARRGRRGDYNKLRFAHAAGAHETACKDN